jgi:hypothetical protein
LASQFMASQRLPMGVTVENGLPMGEMVARG